MAGDGASAPREWTARMREELRQLCRCFALHRDPWASRAACMSRNWPDQPPFTAAECERMALARGMQVAAPPSAFRTRRE